MKKTMFLIALPCFLIFNAARSQTVKIGVNAGMSIPDLMSSGSNEISKDFKSRLAEVFGVFADFHVKKNFH